jgi:NAD(P)-dependent dehydrogenase (short-subunit alcohol dehydrogenase family)
MGYKVVEFSRSGATRGNVPTDLSDTQAAQANFTATFTQYAAKDYDDLVAINNAGTLFPIGPVARKDPVEVVANLQVNFVSQILFMRAFIAQFQQRACRKTLVNISSGAAVKSYAGWSLYCAAKAGIESFVRTLAVEQAGEAHPITALNFDPGIMDTDMQAHIRAAEVQDFPDRSRFIAYQAKGVLKQPSDVASAVIRLIHQPPQVVAH